VTEGFDTGHWCIVELMGHRRLAGFVREVSLFGGAMMRLDIHTGDDIATQYYGAAAVYCVTPTNEETARSVAAPPPTPSPWALPAHDTADEPYVCPGCDRLIADEDEHDDCDGAPF